jgi:hypothetical protein
MERWKFDALRDATQAAEGFFVRAPLQCVPASQTRASREQLRAGLRRKEGSIWSRNGGLKEALIKLWFARSRCECGKPMVFGFFAARRPPLTKSRHARLRAKAKPRNHDTRALRPGVSSFPCRGDAIRRPARASARRVCAETDSSKSYHGGAETRRKTKVESYCSETMQRAAMGLSRWPNSDYCIEPTSVRLRIWF